MPDIVSARRVKREDEPEALQAQLYQQIGQLKVEFDWLKKAGLVQDHETYCAIGSSSSQS